MNKLEQAARQVLEWYDGNVDGASLAFTALREALADQAEQEPVAWWNGKETVWFEHELDDHAAPDGCTIPLYAAPVQQAEQEPVAWVWLEDWLNDGYPEDCFSRVNHQNKTPLYAAPVRTKDLTDDEIWKANKTELPDCQDLVDFARAVIAADREKNK